MGFRLDIYKNSIRQENNLFYGTELIGYVKGNESNLLCVQYLCTIRSVSPDDFGFWYAPTFILRYDEFKKFIYLYFFDLTHDEFHYPSFKGVEKHKSIYDCIQYGKGQIENIMKQINFLDEIIVSWS